MSFVTDPDDLDRFQVAIDPINQTISIRGHGPIRVAKATDGDVSAASTFDSAGSTFITDSVTAGDILTIVSGTNIGHYTVASVGSETQLTISETFADTGEAAGQTFRINEADTTGIVAATVGDGVTLQALYSFLKEEWRTFDTGLFTGGEASDLIKFVFPLVSITREQFEIGGTNNGDWDFADDTTRNLLRTGGWAQVDSGGNTKAIYTGIVTLGTLDDDAQAYYQQHATTADPADFVLTGAVNQSINVFDEVTGPDAGTGFAITANNTITRNDGGNWATDGYVAGGSITIRAAEDAGNNGTFTIASVANSVDGALVVTGTPLTNNAADTTMIAAVDKRFFLKLFARKKARTYPSSQLSDIGVTTLESIVNRFPLTHAVDPAIVLDDGQLAGDPSNTVFKSVETHTTGSDGATSTPAADGTFTFTSAGSTFNDGVLQPGDSLQITSGSDQGYFEISAIGGATTLTVFQEPTTAFTGSESTLNFTVRTNTRDSGLANATLTDSGGGTGTVDSLTATFTTDGGLGDRIVQTGDFFVVTSGDADAIGVYKVTGVTDADTITVDISDADWTAGPFTNQTYIIKRPGMHLQRFETLATYVDTGAETFTFANADPDTLTRSAGSWVTDGFTAGMAVTIAGAANAANNGTFIVDTVSATVLTFIDEVAFTAEGPTAASGYTVTGDTGIVRTLNSVDYPFHWRLFGNGGTLAQTYQFLQRELRRATDIDEGNGTSRGDVTDLLISFSTPTGTTFDLYIDDLAVSDQNNATFEDISGEGRNFAFVAGVTISLNDNILNDSNAKVVVFFTDADAVASNGDEFGTDGAIIVQNGDGTGSPTIMQAITGGGGDNATIANPLQFTFDYDNNNQGGRTPATDADVTIVCIGTDRAVYVSTTGTIQRQNNNSFALVAALERNYSNP